MSSERLQRILAVCAPDEAWAEVIKGTQPEGAGNDAPRKEGSDSPATTRRRVLRWAEQEAERTARWTGAARNTDVTSLWDRYCQAGIGVVHLRGDGYPPELSDDPEAPPILFFRGSRSNGLVELPAPRVAMIGTRSSTGYGRDVATAMGAALAEVGVSVISGLAHGIDTAAHRGALSAEGGVPIAVVGSGLDVVYPPSSRHLWQQIAERGLLISEFPLGSSPSQWHFPARNRIIAALAHVVVVVESRTHGGAMHTVAAADLRGIPVMAVPGSVKSRASEGTNMLLHSGSGVARGADDVLMELSLMGWVLSPREASEGADSNESATDFLGAISPVQQRVLEVINWDPTPTGKIIDRLPGMSVGMVTVTLAALEEAGVVRSGAGWWERV